MNRTAMLALGMVGAIALGTATQAADVLPVNIVAPVVVPPPANTAAFVEVFGGFDLFNRNFEGGECSGCHGLGAGFGGNGQATWMMSSSLSMQLGVWTEHWSGRATGELFDTGPWEANRLGIGTHLSVHINDLLVGGFASIGNRDGFGFGTFATAGLEAALNVSRFRAYAQAGMTFGVAPDWVRDNEIRNLYARVVGTFYATSNLAFSANVGGALIREGGAPAGNMITWGSRTDFQIAGTPLYFTGAYQGAIGRYPPDPSVTNVVEHTFRIGLGLNIGSPDIQTRDRNVGLADFNCLYGVAGTPTIGCGETSRKRGG